ncbi:MAG: branched chain amino acid aminotransferase, partial [Clostridia bacterium]|nr:branched chain amino acid aminotransferase [Clostridia bacterium]
MEIKITRTSNPKAKPADESKLGFGKVFSDHMFIMDYSADKGWHDARIVPFDYIPIHPAASVLHYGTEIFEGLKAYRTVNGDISLFRPIENIRRMNNSAERLCLPQIDEADALQIFDTLVEVDKDWVPHSEGTSLYIRPFMIGNDENLGVHAVHNAKYIVILSPSGAYYAEGINPVK